MSKKMKRNIIIAAAVLLVAIIAVVIVLLIPSSDTQNTSSADEFRIDHGIDMEYTRYEDGLLDIIIHTNDKGEIENNSYGNLLNYVPSQIYKMTVKTQDSNYTFLVNTPVDEDGKTMPTVYTLEGFEDFNLAITNPGLIANAVSSVDFIKVADLKGDNAGDYGFDDPRAVITAYFNDDENSYSVLKVGDDAPGSSHAYVQFGKNKTVYIVNKSEIEPLLLSFNDLFDPSINSDKTAISDSNFDKIILGGTHLDEKISFSVNNDVNLNCFYLSDENMPVNTIEASAIMGSIKSLTAESVVGVNPDDSQLEKFGLKTPFATVKTNYLSEEGYDEKGNPIDSEIILSVSLLASEADAEGMVYMMEEGGKLVYKIDADNIPWATTSKEKLAYEYVLTPNYSALSEMKIEADGKTYEFLLGSEEVPYTDESGNTSAYLQPIAFVNNKALDATQFSIFYQDLMILEVAGADNGTETKDCAMKITYTYASDRKLMW